MDMRLLIRQKAILPTAEVTYGNQSFHLVRNHKLTVFCFKEILNLPGDTVTKIKQINSQSESILMLNFAGPIYLTIRSSAYIILT